MTVPDGRRVEGTEDEPVNGSEPEEIDAQALLDAVARAIAALRKDAARAFPGDPQPDRGVDEGGGAAHAG